MELLKRYTTITMGPCQGKACMVPSQRLCARATGSTFAETKRTTSRPPWTPVELGTLAGARRTPRKETTMHDLHTDGGRRDHVGRRLAPTASLLDAPSDEVEAVRNRGRADRRLDARQVPDRGSAGGPTCSSGSTPTGSPTSRSAASGTA